MSEADWTTLRIVSDANEPQEWRVETADGKQVAFVLSVSIDMDMNRPGDYPGPIATIRIGEPRVELNRPKQEQE